MHPLLTIFLIFSIFTGKVGIDIATLISDINHYNYVTYINSVSNFAKNEIMQEIPFISKYAFDYAIKESGEEGGIISFSSLISRISSNYAKNFRNDKLEINNVTASLRSTGRKISLGMKNKIKDEGEIVLTGKDKKGDNLFEYKIEYKVNSTSQPRIQLLYDKARMFHYYAVEGKPIVCLFWDGETKIFVGIRTYTGKKFKTYLVIGNKRYDIDFNQKLVYTIPVNTEKREIVIKWKYCEDCDEETTVLTKGKQYHVCINYNLNKPLEDYIYEKLESYTSVFPRYVYGESSCRDTRYPKDEEEALAWALCGKGSSSSCVEPKLKKLFENKIQSLMNSIMYKENSDGIEWDTKVEIKKAEFITTDEFECSWKKKCKCEPCEDGIKKWICKPCPVQSSSTESHLTYEVRPLAKYYLDEVYWRFKENFNEKTLTDKEIEDFKKCSKDEYCDCKNDCKYKIIGSPSGCSCRLVKVKEIVPRKCVIKDLHKWAYSYKYVYSFKIMITIKDTSNKIILTK